MDQPELKAADPRLSRPASIAAGTRNLEEARKKRQRQLAQGSEALVEDRSNPHLELEIANDPTEFMRKQLTVMLVKETAVNEQLYAMTPIDNKSLSDSTTRLISLGNALKALPSQSNLTNTGKQKSLAEAIQDALNKRGEDAAKDTEDLQASMMDRSAAHFGGEES